MNIEEASILSDDAQRVIALLDLELLSDYAPEDMHGVDYESFDRGGESFDRGGVFVIGYDQQTPIACGGLRPMNDADVELKRMFVVKTYRGRGVSRQLLEFLEDRARQLGFRK